MSDKLFPTREEVGRDLPAVEQVMKDATSVQHFETAAALSTAIKAARAYLLMCAANDGNKATIKHMDDLLQQQKEKCRQLTDDWEPRFATAALHGLLACPVDHRMAKTPSERVALAWDYANYMMKEWKKYQ